MDTPKPAYFRPFWPRVSWMEFNQNLQIDLRHKYVYFEVAKCACSTIKKRLNPLAAPGLPEPPTVHPDVFSSAFTKAYQLPDAMMDAILAGQDSTRFTFLREPTERFVSAYLEKIGRDTAQRERFRKSFYPDLDKTDTITPQMFMDGILRTEKISGIDKHWRPQADLIFDGVQTFDFIGTVAHFERDWDTLMGMLGLPVAPDRKNITWHATAAKDKIDDILSPELERQVEDFYARDYLLYDAALNR